MNFPSPTQSLQARAQPGGITPELIRLLAQMKVKQETDAAARDMAMKMGQQPPTVADSVNAELEGNARQQIEQKLGGLQALSQQQAPQGAPTMPAPPEQPTQHMAAGGLMKMRSNLPTKYAGGGIVAFDDGGGVDEAVAGWLEKLGLIGPKIDSSEKMSPQERQAQALAEVNKVDLMNPQTPHRGVGDDPRLLPGSRSAPVDSKEPPTLRPGETDESYRARFRAWLNDKPAAPPAVAPRASVPASGIKQALQMQTPPPVAAPVTLSSVEKAMNDALGRSGAGEETAARTAARARLESELGGDQAALRVARQQDYEQAKAAQAARDSKGELSIWDRLGTLGQNAAYGNWGRAAGQQRGMELAHEAQKAEGAKGLLALKQASDAALLNDKMKAFDFGEGKGSEALKSVAEAQKSAMGDASRLLGQRGQDAAHIQGIGMNNETQLKVANIQAASHKAAAKIAADRQDQVDKRNDITGLKSEIAAAEKSLAKYTPQALMLLTPGTPEHAEAIQEMAWAKAVREANRARLAELTGVEYKTAPGATAPGLDLSKWGQPKVK